MSDSVFDRFVERSPVAVMAAALLGRAFTAERLDRLIEQNAGQQHEQDLLFSSVFTLMSKVVCATQPSINAAYQAAPEGDIDVSVVSVYNKLNALETSVSAAMVQYSAEEAAPIVEELEAELSPVIEGFETRIIDGTCIEASEHRIEELRREGGWGVAGQSAGGTRRSRRCFRFRHKE
jgi:hypothetical protein